MTLVNQPTTNIPSPNRPQRMNFLSPLALCPDGKGNGKLYLVLGSCDAISKGKGIQSIMISEEMLKTALVMR